MSFWRLLANLYSFTSLILCCTFVLNTLLETYGLVKLTQNTTLCGGSLGSRVDEERSKVRELM